MVRLAIVGLAIGVLIAVVSGCRVSHPHHRAAELAAKFPPAPETPRELSKIALPRYTVEPPDILVIEGINIMPKMPYRLRARDVIGIAVANPLPNQPLGGSVSVEPGGSVNLGVEYGSVAVAGLTMEEAEEAIRSQLRQRIDNPEVTISLVEMAGLQQISGQHLVSPDGTVSLGSYGSVVVVGLTLEDATRAIEHHLSQFLEDPEIALNVFAYNSRAYYVILEGGGLGDSVTKFPITGNDTVLDAISNVNGLTEVSSKKIWVARAVPHEADMQILPVDWTKVAAGGVASTNFQLLPGDRVFIAEDKMVAYDTHLGKLFAPFERIFGFSLLGVGTVTRFSGPVLRGGGNPGNGNNNIAN